MTLPSILNADAAAICALERQFSAGTYAKRDIALVRGSGVRVEDADGKTYIDCIAGIGVACLGHAHPDLTAAISDQAQTLVTAQEIVCSPLRAAAQQRVAASAGPDFNRVFFSNSGTEAVEAAIKFALYTTKRSRILALKKAYHGKTLGSLAATSEEKYREPFQAFLGPSEHILSGNEEQLNEAWNAAGDDIAAFIFEPVQGEGGIRLHDRSFIEHACNLARERGALVIVDEVQSGVGRTGAMWAHHHLGIVPDIICSAKGLGGGVPIGATILRDTVGELAPLIHTTTFGGNLLACRAALTVLDVIKRDNLIANAAEVGSYLMNRLREADLKIVREVRGMGLMIGLELKNRAGSFLQPLADRGVLVLLAGPRVIRLLPPLILSKKDADEIADVLITTLGEA